MRILVQEPLFPFSVAKYSFFNGQLEVGEEDCREELCSLIFKISLIFLQAPKFCPPFPPQPRDCSATKEHLSHFTHSLLQKYSLSSISFHTLKFFSTNNALTYQDSFLSTFVLRVAFLSRDVFISSSLFYVIFSQPHLDLCKYLEWKLEKWLSWKLVDVLTTSNLRSMLFSVFQ